MESVRVGGGARVTIDEELVLWQGWTEVTDHQFFRQTDTLTHGQTPLTMTLVYWF